MLGLLSLLLARFATAPSLDEGTRLSGLMFSNCTKPSSSSVVLFLLLELPPRRLRPRNDGIAGFVGVQVVPLNERPRDLLRWATMLMKLVAKMRRRGQMAGKEAVTMPMWTSMLVQMQVGT
jgi:hypothetical protein